MPNIYDIARHAEVSVATVSRVLNDDPSVRPGNRRLVLEAIAALDYVPNAAARTLSNSRSGTIGLVVADLTNPAFQRTIEGVAKVVSEHGYSLLLCDSRRDEQVQATSLKKLLERRVEGLVFGPISPSCPELELFLRAQVPVLVISAIRPTVVVPQMWINRKVGLEAAIEYLHRLGHRRIALANAQVAPSATLEEEFAASLRRVGLQCDPGLAIPIKLECRYMDQTKQAFSRTDHPTAVISGSHPYAPVVIAGIYAAGLDIPRDVSVITVGDSPWAYAHRPTLTVIAEAEEEPDWGPTAANYIFARIRGETGEELLHEVRYELRIRGSCAVAPTPGDGSQFK